MFDSTHILDTDLFETKIVYKKKTHRNKIKKK